MPGKKVAQAPAVATKGSKNSGKDAKASKAAPKAAPKAVGKGAKAKGESKKQAKSAANRQKRIQLRYEKKQAAAKKVAPIHSYPRVSRALAKTIKASQAKQRAIQVRKTKERALAAAKSNAKGTGKKGSARVRTSLHFHRPRTLRKLPSPKYPASFSTGKTSTHKSPYNIVKYPLQTESAMTKLEEHNTIVFIVDSRANKNQIKNAVEGLYNFKSQKINTLIRPDGTKKAFVRLTPDYQALEVANKMGFV